MIKYSKLSADDLGANCFYSFKHEQSWKKQWIKRNNIWSLETVCGSRVWSWEKRIWITEYIKEQIENGGFAIGAFNEQQLVGVICVDGRIIDTYANLTMLFVDDDFQRMGIGKNLISKVKKEALLIGAEKLFISAIPSEETISFYFAVGCTDAGTIIPDFVDTEKDRYLELKL